jgi:hypothetical protein
MNRRDVIRLGKRQKIFQAVSVANENLIDLIQCMILQHILKKGNDWIITLVACHRSKTPNVHPIVV